MEIREVNFNTLGSRSKTAGPPMATYVSPPRPNKQNQVGPSSTTTGTTTKLIQSNVEMSTPAGSHAVPSTTDPQRMMELAEANYAQCPCATCAQYRAYYAMQVSGTGASYMGTSAYAQDAYLPQQQEAKEEAEQEQPPPSVFVSTTTRRHVIPPVMTLGINRKTSGGYHPLTPPMQQQQQLYSYPPQQTFSSTVMYGEPIVAPPVSTHMAALPIDTADEFQRKCVGRVAELACTAEGRSMLMAAMRSQDTAVINAMVSEIAADVERVALDNHGCHVLRALKEYMNASQTALLVSAFNETLVLNLCTVSQHTRRILQALFERPLIDLQPIVDVLAANAQYLAATQQGCISLMRIFEHCDAAQKSQLMAPLVPLFAHIVLDPFGNYVVQCAIEHSGKTKAAQYTVSCFTGELLNMSCNKYASNAVEKIIKVCGDVPAVRRLLLDELIYNPAALLQMVQDSFGNFVVQSIIEHMENPNELKRICDRLRPALLSSPYAAKIEAKLRAKNMSTQQPQPQQSQSQPQHNNNNNNNIHRTQVSRHGSNRRLLQQQQQQK
ncbi:Pumilio RNA-binding repeat [Trypanosoma melophagium]|uniref:Pumilio RNA-binding repeat n=1 Tax=Trypanosoma melophagium TaxID=715481 RepID=UPI003519EC7F|nr:Pumilio RNA-binding repeat [Trypanosoma melophagium]